MKPEFREWVDAAKVARNGSLSIDEERHGAEAMCRELWGPVEKVPGISQILLDGGLGCRVYEREKTNLDAPCIVFFHGGGWSLGSLDSHDGLCRALSNRGECVVVSVDYRLAPEHRFPAAIDDAWASLQGVFTEFRDLRIDPHRIVLAGDSAGANLAAAASRRAARNGLQLSAQVLICPVTDLTMSTPSYVRHSEDSDLTRSAMQEFVSRYLPDASAVVDPDASLLRAGDWAGTAPTLIVTAEFDPLHDEGVRFAELLERSGVSVTHCDLAGTPHGFILMNSISEQASETIAWITSFLKEVWK